MLALGLANLARILLGHQEECEDPLGPSPVPPTDDLDYLKRLRAQFREVSTLG